jgi:hypothetical protein
LGERRNKNSKTNDKLKTFYFADLTQLDSQGNPKFDKNNIARVYLTRGPTDIPYPWNIAQNLNQRKIGVAITEYYKGSGKIWKRYYIEARTLQQNPTQKPVEPTVDCFLKRREEFREDSRVY